MKAIASTQLINKKLSPLERALVNYQEGRVTLSELIVQVQDQKISSDELQEYWIKHSEALMEIVWSQSDEKNWLWVLTKLSSQEKLPRINQILKLKISSENVINLIHQETLTHEQMVSIVHSYKTEMDVLIKIVHKSEKYFELALPFLNILSLNLLLPNITKLTKNSVLEIKQKKGWEVLAYWLLKKAEVSPLEEQQLKEQILSEELLDAAWHLWRDGDLAFLPLAIKYRYFDLAPLSWKQKIEVAEFLLKTEQYRFQEEGVWILNWKIGTVNSVKFKTFPELSHWEEKILSSYHFSEINSLKIFGTLSVETQNFEFDGRKLKNQKSINLPQEVKLLGGKISAVAVWKESGYELFYNNQELKPEFNRPQKTERSFGVELEVCLSKSEEEFVAGRDLKSWHCKPDLSIVPKTLQGEPAYSTEIVSPVLQGELGLKEIEEIAKLLQSGVWVNESCGFHVHHDLREYAEMEMAFESIMRESLWITQELVYSLCQRHRQTSVYCLGFKQKGNEIVEPVIPDRDKFGNQVNHPRPGFFLFSNHKTIEFRMREGTTQAEEILSWVEFSSAIVRFMISRTHSQHKRMKIALNDLLYWSEKLKKFSPCSEKASFSQKKIATF